MKREILFRGKCKKTKKWVYGYFYKDYDNQKTYIIDKTIEKLLHLVEVIPKSVGQFTGGFDKNRKEIYEGDYYVYTTTINGKEHESVNKVEVKWRDNIQGFGINTKLLNKIKVVGNIFEDGEKR